MRERVETELTYSILTSDRMLYSLPPTSLDIVFDLQSLKL